MLRESGSIKKKYQPVKCKFSGFKCFVYPLHRPGYSAFAITCMFTQEYVMQFG